MGLWGRCSLWFIAGLLLGGGSLLIFKTSLIKIGALRILNLVLAPILAAFVSEKLTAFREKKRPWLEPREHFWQAFWFTLGLVLVRFTYAAR